MEDRPRAVGLFRYSLVAEAADPALTKRQRGELVRDVASRWHLGPAGERVRVSRNTLDRWIRAYRSGGFDALVPGPRHTDPRTPTEVLTQAETLRKEEPRRTAEQIARLIAEDRGWSPSARTLQRHLLRVELPWRGSSRPEAFGRFEAESRNDLWTGDALHGAVVGGRKTYLFAFIDDHSRTLVGYRWGHSEDTFRLEEALRRGLASRGVPRRLYLDHGSAMVSHQLARACACLGIVLVQSAVRRPQGRGKIERAFRTVTEQFVVEIAHSDVGDLDALNRLFDAWVESVYHRRVHSETGEAPLERFLVARTAGAAHRPSSCARRSCGPESRRVTKTASGSLFGNHYEVDALLVGEQVELVFDAFDLVDISGATSIPT